MKAKLLFIPLMIGFAFVITVSTVFAGPVLVDGPWYEFLFREAGEPAEECLDFCVPSPGGNSIYADSPPWTFTAPPGGVVLTVADVANSGDIFAVYDNGTEIGSTSFSYTGNLCSLDPDNSLQDPNCSQGQFELAEGEHSITIIPIASPLSNGVGYFKVDFDGVNQVFLPLLTKK